MPRRPKPTNLPALPEVLVTQTPQLAACLEELTAAPVIGFDTEFVGEDSYRPELCLIQVATAEKLYVIDPFGVGSLADFWNLLLDPARTIVMHAGREDIRMCFFQAGKPPGNVFDVQLAAGLIGLTYPIGYGGLVFELLGQRMSKAETLTDWRRRPLLPAQIRYAFDDVRFLLPAWKKITDRLKRLKRTEWATEEFDALIKRSIGDEETTAERWRRVKGTGGLDRRGLAVAREVFAWREGFAERVNRPAKHLLRDDVLAEIARRIPARHEDLAALRGVPGKEVEPILEAIRRARALPLEKCPLPEPRDNDPPHILLLGNLLSVVLADWCTRNKLAANLVASGSDLKAVVRALTARKALTDVPLSRGWRSATVLPELQALLQGTLTLRVANPRAASPLEMIPVESREEPEPPPADAPDTL